MSAPVSDDLTIRMAEVMGEQRAVLLMLLSDEFSHDRIVKAAKRAEDAYQALWNHVVAS